MRILLFENIKKYIKKYQQHQTITRDEKAKGKTVVHQRARATLQDEKNPPEKWPIIPKALILLLLFQDEKNLSA